MGKQKICGVKKVPWFGSFGLVRWVHVLFGSMALHLRRTYRSKHKTWVPYPKMLRVQRATTTFRGGEVLIVSKFSNWWDVITLVMDLGAGAPAKTWLCRTS